MCLRIIPSRTEFTILQTRISNHFSVHVQLENLIGIFKTFKIAFFGALSDVFAKFAHQGISEGFGCLEKEISRIINADGHACFEFLGLFFQSDIAGETKNLIRGGHLDHDQLSERQIIRVNKLVLGIQTQFQREFVVC